MLLTKIPKEERQGQEKIKRWTNTPRASISTQREETETELPRN